MAQPRHQQSAGAAGPDLAVVCTSVSAQLFLSIHGKESNRTLWVLKGAVVITGRTADILTVVRRPDLLDKGAKLLERVAVDGGPVVVDEAIGNGRLDCGSVSGWSKLHT